MRASGALTEAAHLQVFFFSSSDPLLNFYKKTKPDLTHIHTQSLLLCFIFFNNSVCFYIHFGSDPRR